MQDTPNAAQTGQLKDKLHDSLESGKETITSSYDTVRKESSQICKSTCECIRENPIAYVAGAAFFGAAVCYLIMENRSQPTFKDRYLSGPVSDASDTVNESLHSAFKTLKFW